MIRKVLAEQPAHRVGLKTVVTEKKSEKFESCIYCVVCAKSDPKMFYNILSPSVHYCDDHATQDMLNFNVLPMAKISTKKKINKHLYTRDNEKIIDITYPDIINTIGGPIVFPESVTIEAPNGNKFYFCNYDDPEYYQDLHGDGELV